MAIRGVEQTKRNYHHLVQSIDQKRTETAVYAVLSQGSALAQTMTPMDTGNLAQSQYAPQINQRLGVTTGKVGYTARYAHAVHEAPGVLKGLPRAHFGTTRAGVHFGVAPKKVITGILTPSQSF
nr:hypothetical protein [Paenalcaligenes hominis]